jgi:hypothetical protein
MSHIFVSHVEEDAEVAGELAAALEAAGYKTWYYERDSTPVASYLVQVDLAIDGCAAFLLLISPRSIASNQVNSEVVNAFERKKPFIPLRLDITHEEFQQRQREWRLAIGGAVSLPVPRERVSSVIQTIVRGLRDLGLPNAVDADSGKPAPGPHESSPPGAASPPQGPLVLQRASEASAGRPYLILLLLLAVILAYSAYKAIKPSSPKASAVVDEPTSAPTPASLPPPPRATPTQKPDTDEYAEALKNEALQKIREDAAFATNTLNSLTGSHRTVPDIQFRSEKTRSALWDRNRNLYITPPSVQYLPDVTSRAMARPRGLADDRARDSLEHWNRRAVLSSNSGRCRALHGRRRGCRCRRSA